MLTNGRSSPPRGGMEICNHVSAFERSHEDIGLGVKYLGGKVPFRGSSVIPFINPKKKKKKGMVYNGHNHQYEAIAREDIAEGEYIGEYAGRVKYTSDSTATSMYVAVRAIKIHFDKPHLAILTCTSIRIYFSLTACRRYCTRLLYASTRNTKAMRLDSSTAYLLLPLLT